MSYQETSDANFFALVHHVLEKHRDQSEDQRRHNRFAFTALQFVAPYRDGRLPRREDFQRVLCHDISPAGFSYVSAKPVDCEFLIAALGAAPFLFLTAQVEHEQPLVVHGRGFRLVGCRFISRLREIDYGPVLGPRPNDGDVVVA